jgi:serine phosphatase RsbU (regulator of sigma subunit)
MTADQRLIVELHRRLDRAEPFELLDVLRAELGERLGAKHVSLLLADYGETSLEELRALGEPVEVAESLPLEETRAGVVFRSQEAAVDRTADEWSVQLPVSVRADRLGVLDVTLPTEPDAEAVVTLEHVASLMAYAVVAARRYTDMFERVRRRRHLTLAAELQWELLPVTAYRTDRFSLGGQLEPAYEVGGDTFDYAAEHDRLTLGVTDAVGHGLRSALMGGLAVTAMRNSRRGGGGPLEQFDAANRVIFSQFGDQYFVTAMLLDVDLTTGEAMAVNAGHSYLWRIRRGRAALVPLEADLPVGLVAEPGFRLQPVEIAVGDRLVLLTDGVLEASPATRSQPFGAERLERLLEEIAEQSPPEAARRVVREVLRHQGRELDDDATVLCVDFFGSGAATP